MTKALLALLVLALSACSEAPKHDAPAQPRDNDNADAGTLMHSNAGAGGSSTATTGMETSGEAGMPHDVPPKPELSKRRSLLDIAGVAYGNDRFVAVGVDRTSATADPRGIVYTSDDGFEWSASRPEGEPSPIDIAFGNGVFVMTVQDAQSVRACVSDDGDDWACGALPEPTRAAPDDDADAGSEPASPLQDPGRSLAFGNGVFVVALMQDVFRSDDGVLWSRTEGMPKVSSFRGVEFGGNAFVAWSAFSPGRPSDLITSASTDGATWHRSATGIAGLLSNTASYAGLDTVFGSADGFAGVASYNCCFGETGGPWSVFFESADGREWTAARDRDQVPLLREDDLCIAAIRPVGIPDHANWPRFMLTAGKTCDATASIDQADELNPLVAIHEGPAYVIAGYGGIVSSKDGVHFERTLRRDE